MAPDCLQNLARERAAKSAHARTAPGGVPETAAAAAPPRGARSKAKDCESFHPQHQSRRADCLGDALFENTENKTDSCRGEGRQCARGPACRPPGTCLEAGRTLRLSEGTAPCPLSHCHQRGLSGWHMGMSLRLCPMAREGMWVFGVPEVISGDKGRGWGCRWEGRNLPPHLLEWSLR